MRTNILALLLMLFTLSCENRKQTKPEVNSAPMEPQIQAPLFIDPNYHGSCDPEIIFNPADQHYYIYYTARRSTRQNNFLSTPLGVIRSKDLVEWDFLGYCKFDGVGGKKDASSTYWAPAIIEHEGKFHMFVSWKPDTVITNKGPWGGPCEIVHYECPTDDPVNGWKKVANMHDKSLATIDATVFKMEDKFHVWFKGKKKGTKRQQLYHMESEDLYSWNKGEFLKSDVFNKAVTGEGFEEAPFVFRWKDRYWLITDPHKGLLVYNSADGKNWEYQDRILSGEGQRSMDNSRARHCSVAVVNDRAFVFYHVEPWRIYDSGDNEKAPSIAKQPIENRRSVLQMAELTFKNGKIACERDQTIPLPIINHNNIGL